MGKGLMSRRLALLGALGAAAVAPVSHGLQAQAAVAPPPAPTFSTPTVSGIQGLGYEQDLRYDSVKNVYYTSVPDAVGGGPSFLWRSLDGGLSFKWVPAATAQQGKLPGCVGGGDTELATDTAGNLLFNDLTLANFSTGRSTDMGRTLAVGCESTPSSSVDRQWYATTGDITAGGSVFLSDDLFLQDNTCGGHPTGNVLAIQRSPIASDPASGGIQFGPVKRVTAPCDDGITGNIEVSPRKAPVTGNTQVFDIHDTITFDAIKIARCEVVSFLTDPSGLTCVDKPVASFPGSVMSGSFPAMAVDSAGNLYATWPQGPGARGALTGDSVIMFSRSLDNGDSWSTPVALPNTLQDGTTVLHNNSFAWAVGGDPGRLDIAYYGTPAVGTAQGGFGPGHINGDWSVFMSQSLDGGTTWSSPVLASEHFVHRGSVQTVGDGGVGDRTLGDFINVRLGPQGEAVISYADNNNQFVPTLGYSSQSMVAHQGGGPGLYASKTVSVPARVNGVIDPCGNATLDASGVSSHNIPNLDILSSTMAIAPDQTHYRINMVVADLTSLAPDAQGGGTDLVWSTQWKVPDPTGTDPLGGHYYHAYMESTAGQAPKFFDGESGELPNGGNGSLTYPGANAITGTYTPTAPGTITIDVPFADAKLYAGSTPASTTLYSVVSSSQTLTTPANSNNAGGGVLFNLINPTPTYDFVPTAPAALLQIPSCLQVVVPEAPLAGGLVAVGAAAAVGFFYRRRRRTGPGGVGLA